MNNREIFETYDEVLGLSQCVIFYKTKGGVTLTAVGQATCHPKDEQFKSKLTGSIIAEYRAEIALLRQINDYELKPGIVALKHVYCTMRHSKSFDPKSYECVRIKRELAHLLDELEENKMAIKSIQDCLHTYLEEKDKAWRKFEQKGQD